MVVGKKVPGPSAGSPPPFCNLAKSEVPPGLAAAVFFRDLPKGRWRPDLPSPRKEIFRFGERGRGAARQGCPKRQSLDNLAKPRDVDPFENKFDKHI